MKLPTPPPRDYDRLKTIEQKMVNINYEISGIRKQTHMIMKTIQHLDMTKQLNMEIEMLKKQNKILEDNLNLKSQMQRQASMVDDLVEQKYNNAAALRNRYMKSKGMTSPVASLGKPPKEERTLKVTEENNRDKILKEIKKLQKELSKQEKKKEEEQVILHAEEQGEFSSEEEEEGFEPIKE